MEKREKERRKMRKIGKSNSEVVEGGYRSEVEKGSKR